MMIKGDGGNYDDGNNVIMVLMESIFRKKVATTMVPGMATITATVRRN